MMKSEVAAKFRSLGQTIIDWSQLFHAFTHLWVMTIMIFWSISGV